MNYSAVIKTVVESRAMILSECKSQSVTEKGFCDFVTNVDLAVQDYLADRLGRICPGVAFVSEEQQTSAAAADSYWILDPIDGTTNLMHGLGQSAVSLAHVVDGTVVFGIIFNPFTGEAFHAQTGRGAYVGDTPIRVRNVTALDQCLVGIGTTPYDKSRAPENFRLFEEIFAVCRDIRRLGAAALDAAYVAAGRLDVFFERDLKPWDYAAGMLLVTESGGKFTDWEGNAPAFSNSDILAANPQVHELMLEFISKHK